MSNINDNYDIRDNEIRVIGQTSPCASESKPLKQNQPEKVEPKRSMWKWYILFFVLALIVGAAIFFMRPQAHSNEDAPVPTSKNEMPPTQKKARGYCTEERKELNGINLRFVMPHDVSPELIVGSFPLEESDIVLAAMAADVRADNAEIAGGFVVNGQLIAKGHPKKGFCSIINDEVKIGMAHETPYFEKAIDEGGCFFRQFALVIDRRVGESTPKGNAVRRALCQKDGSLFIAESEGAVSYADFAKALVEYGVQNAIGLMGAVDLTLSRDKSGNADISDLAHYNIQGSNYIVWR